MPLTLKVSDVMSKKVVTVDVTDSAYDAVRKIMNHDIGCVVVTKGDKIAGLITKGDILREAVMKKLDTEKISADKIMSQPVVSTKPETSVEDAAELMSSRNLTKLPVLRDGKLVGIVTSTDILRKGGKSKTNLKDMI